MQNSLYRVERLGKGYDSIDVFELGGEDMARGLSVNSKLKLKSNGEAGQKNKKVQTTTLPKKITMNMLARYGMSSLYPHKHQDNERMYFAGKIRNFRFP